MALKDVVIDFTCEAVWQGTNYFCLYSQFSALLPYIPTRETFCNQLANAAYFFISVQLNWIVNNICYKISINSLNPSGR